MAAQSYDLRFRHINGDIGPIQFPLAASVSDVKLKLWQDWPTGAHGEVPLELDWVALPSVFQHLGRLPTTQTGLCLGKGPEAPLRSSSYAAAGFWMMRRRLRVSWGPPGWLWRWQPAAGKGDGHHADLRNSASHSSPAGLTSIVGPPVKDQLVTIHVVLRPVDAEKGAVGAAPQDGALSCVWPVSPQENGPACQHSTQGPLPLLSMQVRPQSATRQDPAASSLENRPLALCRQTLQTLDMPQATQYPCPCLFPRLAPPSCQGV